MRYDEAEMLLGKPPLGELQLANWIVIDRGVFPCLSCFSLRMKPQCQSLQLVMKAALTCPKQTDADASRTAACALAKRCTDELIDGIALTNSRGAREGAFVQGSLRSVS